MVPNSIPKGKPLVEPVAYPLGLSYCLPQAAAGADRGGVRQNGQNRLTRH